MAASNYDDVCSQLAAAGLLFEQPLQVGTARAIRCKVQDGGREKRGWYWLHELYTDKGDLLIVGSFGVWRGMDANTQKVELGKSNPLTSEQRDALKRRLAEDRRAAEATRKRQAAQAARRAQRMWDKLATAGESPYLEAKGVGAHGLRFTPHGTAVLPLLDPQGNVHGLQFLRTEKQAREGKRPAKEFWPEGVAKKGHYHLLGHSPHWIILVAEGYATAASLYEATGYPVACAFDAGNIGPVVAALHKAYRRAKILICADDDAFTEGNPGVTAASTAALEVSGAWVLPRFADEPARQALKESTGRKLTDFNDLHKLEGLHVIRRQIEQRLAELGWDANLRAVSSPSTAADAGGQLRPINSADELLRRYALVYAAGGAVFDRQEHCLLPLGDVRNACLRADIFKYWMEHGSRAIVRQDEVGFDPGAEDPRVTCNLWGGWPTEPKAGSCEHLLELLRYMCSGESNATTLYDWVLKWVAYPIQHPGAKMKTTIVVHGPQGTGKNLFFEAVMGIYGKYGRILDQDALHDKHNDWASRKLFLIADEVVAQKDRYDLKNKLKTLITGTWVRINPKHIAAYDEANHVNLVFLSNESMPAVLEEDDRRHCVIWTPGKKDKAFYDALLAEIRNGGIAALHHHLLHLPLGDFNPGTPPPDTRAKRELIDLAQDSPVEFVDAVLFGDIPQVLQGRGPGEGCPVPGLTSDWYRIYTRWCSSVGVKPASLKRFVDALAKRRGYPAVRKRYIHLTESGLGDECRGPHSILMFGQAPPEGASDERDWLGHHVATLRNAASEYMGARP